MPTELAARPRPAPRAGNRFRRSLAIGTLLVALACAALEWLRVESTAYFGGAALASRYELARHDEALDVIAIGPSHVENGFDAELFGARTGTHAFNFGVAGTDLHFQSLLVRQVLIPQFRPRAILWGVLDRLNTANPINEQYLHAPVLARAESDLGARVIGLEHVLPQWKKRRLGQWLERLLEPLAASGPLGQSRVDEVWDQIPGPSRAADRADAAGEDSDVQAVADPVATVRAFDEALRFARAEGVQVYVFMAPYDPANFERGAPYCSGRFSGRYREYDEWLTRTCARHEVPLVNLRYCAGITDATGCFYQPRHLNERGARAMTVLRARIYAGEPIPAEWRGSPSGAERAALGLPQ